jgi:sugar (pentulose or hexulose) kinase
MTDRFVIAFDVGTSGVKAVLPDLGGRVVASRHQPYGLRCLDDGWVEQDVGEIYGRLGAACRSLHDRQGVAPGHVEAVSVTAQMFNVVPVGAAGEPLRPMLSWLDTRAAPQAAALARRMGPDEQFRRLGATITANPVSPALLPDVGAGAIGHGDAQVSLGTAVYFGSTLDRPAADPGRQLGVLGHMDPKRYILWLEIATGVGQAGPAPDYAEVDRLVAERLDDDGSLLFAPWLSGERVPVFDDRARAAFVGLDLSHDRGHLLRALMEGVAYQMRWALEYAAAFGEPIGSLRAVGGGGIGASWTQVIADVLDRPLLCVRDPQDAAARGAAACALVGIGVEPDLAFARHTAEVERTLQPVPSRRPRHQRQYGDYQALYRALAPLYHRAGS